MTDTTALHEALERGIGSGPAGPDLETVLHDGHRLVRRRRAAAAVATLALVVVTGAGSLALGGLGSPGSAPVAPADGGPTDAGGLDAGGLDPGGLDAPLSGAEVMHFQVQPDGKLLGIGPDAAITFPLGIEVVRHVDDALGLAPEEPSTAYVVRDKRGETRWYLARVRPTGPSTSTAKLVLGVPGVDAATFEDWIAAQGS